MTILFRFLLLPFVLIANVLVVSLGNAQEAAIAQAAIVQGLTVHDTVTLSFEGPSVSESDQVNPFTDYRLLVQFSNGDQSFSVRGFYAADGNAAETSAKAGNVWKVRFKPNRTGKWTYRASLQKGNWIATETEQDAGESIKLSDPAGSFNVSERNGNREVDDRDFRHFGRLHADGHYYRFEGAGPYWIKGGTNSPENLLANVDFDDTYRMSANQRDGEAKITDQLHRFDKHLQDYRDGDPTWKGDKGKGLIGGVNYLADSGMNSIYFLTMNITGDGKDVWPYADPEDFSRFDCSKLDQWEIVFDHMQRRGIQLHVITQETENEKLLDDGDVGKHRSLYYSELIARFGHHLAIVWNLGEENGPANFSPNGQTPKQTLAMADYFKSHDPYNNAVIVHTHASRHHQDEILPKLLGHRTLDGLSLQVGQPKNVHRDVSDWRLASAKAGRTWTITMDEIGPADSGAVTDAEDLNHDQVRGPVLWGSLLGGGGGVEWYFGYKHPHNDLNCEDWRSRDRMWKLTDIALDFFRNHLPYWKMQPHDQLISGRDGYCFADPGNVYAIYAAVDDAGSEVSLDLSGTNQTFRIHWLDVIHGGPMTVGSKQTVQGGKIVSLGVPPKNVTSDWVALVQRK